MKLTEAQNVQVGDLVTFGLHPRCVKGIVTDNRSVGPFFLIGKPAILIHYPQVEVVRDTKESN